MSSTRRFISARHGAAQRSSTECAAGQPIENEMRDTVRQRFRFPLPAAAMINSGGVPAPVVPEIP